MKRTIIAVLLGWLGGYRFYKKQYLLGFVYLLTFGLFGIGWIVDIIQAVQADLKDKKPIVLMCEIKGGFAECKKNPKIKRKDILAALPVGSPLILESDYYEGKPFFLVCTQDNMDIGSIPREINGMIRNEYPNAKLSAVLANKDDLECAQMTLTIER